MNSRFIIRSSSPSGFRPKTVNPANVSHIQDNDVDKLIRDYKWKKDLTSLDIGVGNLQELSLSKITYALKANTTLESLNIISNYNRTTAHHLEFIKTVINHPTIKNLTINNYLFTPEVVAALAVAIRFNKTPENLDLESTNIRAAGAQAIADALATNNTLKSLHLGGNNIGDAGARAILLRMTSTGNILDINLSNTGITDASITIIANLIKMGRLRNIDLSNNHNITNAGLRTLSNALNHSGANNLHSLKIDSTTTNTLEGRQQICAVLATKAQVPYTNIYTKTDQQNYNHRHKNSITIDGNSMSGDLALAGNLKLETYRKKTIDETLKERENIRRTYPYGGAETTYKNILGKRTHNDENTPSARGGLG